MKKFNQKLSFLLIFCLVFECFSGFIIPSKAAIEVVNLQLSVVSYEEDGGQGNLTLSWNGVPGTKSILVKYHDPKNNEGFVEEYSDQTVNIYELDGTFQNDYMYDISVYVYDEVFDTENPGNNQHIAAGFFYFIPDVTFKCESVEQQRTALNGGGYEIGDIPRMNIQFNMPKVWVEDSESGEGAFEYVNSPSSLSYIESTVNTVYSNDVYDISDIGFKINISTDEAGINGGSALSSLIIEEEDSEYRAYISGKSVHTEIYNKVSSDGILEFQMAGRRDTSVNMPTAIDLGVSGDDEILPEHHILPYPEIYPGTIYFMSIDFTFKDTVGNESFSVFMGDPSKNNKSMVTNNGYMSTPVRIQLSKDSYDNVYVKIFEIQESGLDISNITYEIQLSDRKTLKGDWPIEKTIDQTYFNESTNDAVVILTDLGVANEYFYKVVVKAGSDSFRMESNALNYIISEDKGKPPVPRNVTVIGQTLVYKDIIYNGESFVQKSSDIKISWEKPSNWSELKENKDVNEDIVYHFLLSTSQVDVDLDTERTLISEGRAYGRFPIEYRKVKHISSLDPNIEENGTSLEYTFKGFELFEKATLMSDYTSEPVIDEINLVNVEEYPTFLLSNKTYFLQIYTTTGANIATTNEQYMSERSITTSFTTKGGNEYSVPIPKNLRISQNSIESKEVDDELVYQNFIDLQFDKIAINWDNYTSDTSVTKAVYYEVYMGIRTKGEFIFLGSTKANENVKFIGDKDTLNSSIKLSIKDFVSGTDGYKVFGDRLKQNTIYYFKVRTTMFIENQEGNKNSIFSSILPVTTVQIGNLIPNKEAGKLFAVDSFRISENEDGNQLLFGNQVAFDWLKTEDDVKYQIISSSYIPKSDESMESIETDLMYKSFKEVFNEIILDSGSEVLAENFEYNLETEKCKYFMEKWLVPNTLYYFSIRAISDSDNNNYSNWITIPVTTKLIAAPSVFSSVDAIQLRLFWADTDLNTKISDYRILAKGPEDFDYVELPRNALSIVKNEFTYYARINSLIGNSLYNIKVYKGSTLITEKIGLKTLDKFHEIEVRWKAIKGYKYQLMSKTPSDDEYINLTSTDFEQFYDFNGDLNPYYIEENIEKSNIETYSYYYARIKKIAVKRGSNTISEKLLSNMKYYIKLRAVKVDELDENSKSYSKFIGPISIRTEFNQEDRDSEEYGLRKKAKYLDEVNEIDDKLFWRIQIGRSKVNKIWVKTEKFRSAVLNNGDFPYILDVSMIDINLKQDILYIPFTAIRDINSENKSFIIKTIDAEYMFRPNSISLTDDINKYLNSNNLQELYFKVSIKRNQKSAAKVSDELVNISSYNVLDIKAIGGLKTEEQIKAIVDDKLYNENNGIITEKIDEIMIAPDKIEISDLVDETEALLSHYFGKLIEGRNNIKLLLKSGVTINKFNEAAAVKLNFEDKKGLKTPLLYYNKVKEPIKLSEDVVWYAGSGSFDIYRTGQYSIMSINFIKPEMSYDNMPKKSINEFLERFDLSDVFSEGIPDMVEYVEYKDTLALMEKILNKPKFKKKSFKQRVEDLDMNDVFTTYRSSQTINKEQFAAILMKIYSQKTDLDINKISSKGYIFIQDEYKIDKKFYKYVILTVELDMLDTDDYLNFKPEKIITYGELIDSFNRLIKIIGEF